MRIINKFIKVTVLLLIGGVLGWMLKGHYLPGNPGLMEEYRINSMDTTLVHPLLYIKTTEDTTPEYKSLKSSLNDYIDSQISQGKASKISVYFREMDSGRWTGVNQDDMYEPSSMLKVLVLMSYLKAAENNPSLFEKTLYYTGKEDPGQYYKPTTKLNPGNYTIPELLKRTIVESDNEAVILLFDYNKKVFSKTYTDLGLPPAPSEDEQIVDFMSPRSYSILFRTLYNATYLSPTLSEQAIQLLTLTTFTKGLTAGIPVGIPVAHKFGEHTELLADKTVVSRQLHDCGIIYRPRNPYFLCVMTRGSDFKDLEGVISGISKLVYDEVSH